MYFCSKIKIVLIILFLVRFYNLNKINILLSFFIFVLFKCFYFGMLFLLLIYNNVKFIKKCVYNFENKIYGIDYSESNVVFCSDFFIGAGS